MTTEDRYDVLVRSLYDAALEPDRWGDTLVGIAEANLADNIHLLVWDPARREPSFSLAPGMNLDMEAAYRDHYGAIDPRRLLVSRLDTGQWLACHHHFDDRMVDRSEFFQDYLIPGDIRYLLGTRLVRCDEMDVFVGMHRAPGRAPFSDAEQGLMKRLTGHFQNACRIWLRTEDLRQRAELGELAMDTLETGIVALSADGNVRYANRYAEALLRKATHLTLRWGKLVAAQTEDSELLDAALEQVQETGHAANLRLRTGRPLGARQCHISIVPVAPSASLSRRVNGASMLVLIGDMQHRRSATVQQLMTIFELTPAEGRLARALATGETLSSYAQANEISINTLKTQLKCVFSKTGTTKQAELVRLLGSIPAVR